MGNKRSIKQYMLIFEPKYAFHQYVINFTSDGKAEVIKIHKNTDRVYGYKSKTVEKNHLCDIDKKTTSCNDLFSLFDTYVDPDIFRYDGFNLHRMFIGYKYNDKICSIDYELNNPQLKEKSESSLVVGNNIDDKETRREMIDLILTSDNNSFLKFVVSEKNKRTTNLSHRVLNNASMLRIAYDNSENSSIIFELKNNLETSLKSYKEFRELFLLRGRYIKYLDEKKQKMEQLKNEAKQAAAEEKQKNAFKLVEVPSACEQMTFFESLNDPVKSKSLDYKK